MGTGPLVIQGRVIHALVLRELKTRFGKMRMGYLWAVLEPMFFVGFFALVYLALGSKGPSGMPLLSFLVTGFGTFMFFRNIFQFTMLGVRINQALLTYPQVTPFNLVLARAVLEFSTVAVVFLLMLAIASWAGDDIQVERPLRVLLVVLLMSLFGLGAGFLASTLCVIFPSTPELTGAFFVRPAFMLSGNFFVADVVPEPARQWALVNPLLHGNELVRDAFFHQFQSQHGNMSYLAGSTAVVLFLGLLMQRGLHSKLYKT